MAKKICSDYAGVDSGSDWSTWTVCSLCGWSARVEISDWAFCSCSTRGLVSTSELAWFWGSTSTVCVAVSSCCSAGCSIFTCSTFTCSTSCPEGISAVPWFSTCCCSCTWIAGFESSGIGSKVANKTELSVLGASVDSVVGDVGAEIVVDSVADDVAKELVEANELSLFAWTPCASVKAKADGTSDKLEDFYFTDQNVERKDILPVVSCDWSK